ncbi:hypothetical protein [Promicromonospora sp. NPDC023805]|uniref:hypothetical protein n=1 Tax=Promicromonospora sp. NPDC023805 TaxID=3154696 RepID=UPI0033C87742
MGRKTGQQKVPVPPGGWPTKRKDKSPQIADPRIPPAKVARSLDVDQDEVLRRRVVWRFGDLDHEWDFSLNAITPEHLTDLLRRLGHFETMQVGQLLSQGAAVGTRYQVAEMRPEIQARLLELERDDEDSVVRLACGGKPRLYGFLREHVFHVLWWDPEHLICPSKLKHT